MARLGPGRTCSGSRARSSRSCPRNSLCESLRGRHAVPLPSLTVSGDGLEHAAGHDLPRWARDASAALLQTVRCGAVLLPGEAHGLAGAVEGAGVWGAEPVGASGGRVRQGRGGVLAPGAHQGGACRGRGLLRRHEEEEAEEDNQEEEEGDGEGDEEEEELNDEGRPRRRRRRRWHDEEEGGATNGHEQDGHPRCQNPPVAPAPAIVVGVLRRQGEGEGGAWETGRAWRVVVPQSIAPQRG